MCSDLPSGLLELMCIKLVHQAKSNLLIMLSAYLSNLTFCFCRSEVLFLSIVKTN